MAGSLTLHMCNLLRPVHDVAAAGTDASELDTLAGSAVELTAQTVWRECPCEKRRCRRDGGTSVVSTLRASSGGWR